MPPQTLTIVKSEPLPDLTIVKSEPSTPTGPTREQMQAAIDAKAQGETYNPQHAAAGVKAGLTPRNQVGRMAADVATGLAQSAYGTVHGAANILRRAPVIGPMLQASDKLGAVTVPLPEKPQNTTQAVGKVGGDIAQMFAPSGALSSVKAAISAKIASPFLETLMINPLLEGASAATIDAAQKGTTKDMLKTGAIAAGATAGVGSALKVAAYLGGKVEPLLRPTAADFADGYKPSTVIQNKLLGNSLGQTYERTQARLNDLSQQLKDELAAHPGITIDVPGALADAETRLAKDAGKNIGDNAAIKRGLSALYDEIGAATPADSNGVVDLAAANEIKQGVGFKGAWFHNPNGPARSEPDAAGMAKVYNAFYASLKEQILKQAGAGGAKLAAINRQIADLIPVQRAIVRRMPVDARQSIIGLPELLSLMHGNPAPSIASHAAKSPMMVRGLIAGGENAPAIAGAAGRVAAGTAGAIKKDQP